MEPVSHEWNDFTAESRTNIYSNGKNIAAILLARLVDCDLLNYEEPVCKYWPEYA